MVTPIQRTYGPNAGSSAANVQGSTGYPIVDTIASTAKTVGSESLNGLRSVFSLICLIGMKKMFQKHPPRVVNFMLLLLKWTPSYFKSLLLLLVHDFKKNQSAYPQYDLGLASSWQTNPEAKQMRIKFIEELTTILDTFFLSPSAINVQIKIMDGLDPNDPSYVCMDDRLWESYPPNKKTADLEQFRKAFVELRNSKGKKEVFSKYLVAYLPEKVQISLNDKNEKLFNTGALDLSQLIERLVFHQNPSDFLSDELYRTSVENLYQILRGLKSAPEANGQLLLDRFPEIQTTVNRLSDVLEKKEDRKFIRNLSIEILGLLFPIKKRSSFSLGKLRIQSR